MDLKRINDFEWGVGDSGKIFASEALIEEIKGDDSLDQVSNVARLPGIIGKSLAMPDIHRGYGFPIGGVAAFDLETGVISPGGVGYDINCSVRLLKTNLKKGDLIGREKELVHSLARCVPSGVGVRGAVKLDRKKLDEVLVGGAQWAVDAGYGLAEDWKHIEDGGKLAGAMPEAVSVKAKGRGMNQLGTLGAGNHFLDVLIVDEVFDDEVARVFGLELGQVVILIHCGSRGLGHQVASDYIKLMGDVARRDDREQMIDDRGEVMDRELVNAPIKSELGKKYFGAMCAAANFAFANKQIISHFVRENLKHYFPSLKMEVVYDICHNIAKVESHFVDGKKKDVLVMRKGATRAFGPGREEICEDYRKVGQPVLLPGSMGTPSYVLVGTNEAMKKSWGSCAHGAGRVMSRSEAHRNLSFDEAKKNMEELGIFVEAGGKKGMIEEAPGSYKDVDEVVRVCNNVGLGRKVVRLSPKLVVIG